MSAQAEVLELDPVQTGEEPMKQIGVWESFKEKAEKLRTTAETLVVTDINDRTGMALARSTRLALREVRIAVIRRHKELKENILLEGRKIDSAKNELVTIIEPLEERLLLQEQFAEREAERIIAEKRAARTAEITPFIYAPVIYDLGTMDDEAYAALLTVTKATNAEKLERERKEREEAQARAKAEQEERARIQAENARLRKEAEEREALARAEQQRAAAELAEQRKEAAKREQALIAQARAAAEEVERLARVEREAARAAALEAERKAQAERAEREKVEAELRAKKAAEEKAAAEKEAARKAAEMAPEREKVKAFAADVRALWAEAQQNMQDGPHTKELADGVEKFAAWVERKAAVI